MSNYKTLCKTWLFLLGNPFEQRNGYIKEQEWGREIRKVKKKDNCRWFLPI
jgi:hypothetical protein